MNIIRNYEVDLGLHLPEFIRKDPELSTVLKVESKEHKVSGEVLSDIFNQFFVDSATWGLSYWERNLGLTPNQNDDYTQRRNRIYLKLQSKQTVTAEFLRKIALRYFSEDADLITKEDNEHTVFWIINKSGRLLYPKDLYEAIDTYIPAHIGLGYEMRRDVETSVKLGIVSAFEGYVNIGLPAPKDTRFALTTAIIPAITGRTRISIDTLDDEKFGVKAGALSGNFGIKEIRPDENDLPKIFRERDSYIAPTVGLASDLKGVKRVYISVPDNGVEKIGFGTNIVKTGRQLYGLAPPKTGVVNHVVGEVILYSGEKVIKTDLSDLPQEYKEKNSRLTPKIGFSSVVKSKKQIGIEKPTDEVTTSKVGFFDGVFGVSIINIDKNDLPNEYKEKDAIAKFFAGFTHTVKSYKRIPTAKAEKSKSVFALGTFQKFSGKKTIPAFSLDKTKNKLYAGSMECITGYKVIGADLSVLEN